MQIPIVMFYSERFDFFYGTYCMEFTGFATPRGRIANLVLKMAASLKYTKELDLQTRT